MEPDFLLQLQSAKSGQKQDWLVMEQRLKSLGTRIQNAAWAAAIPHWFDVQFLNFVIEEPDHLDAEDFEALSAVSFVEPFSEFGFSIHEHSRRLLLDVLWRTDPLKFVDLSRRASRYCLQQDQNEPAWRIEFIYHQLTADYKEGLELLSSYVRKWREEHLDEKAESLIRIALEVAEAGRIPNQAVEAVERANASLKLVYGWKEPKRTEDGELLERFISGDPQAITTVDAWITRAARPFQRRLAHQWEDVLQNIRLEVMRLLRNGSFRGETSLRTYLWRIVSHTCLDQLRLQNKWKWSDLEDVDDPDSIVGIYVDQQTAQKEDKDILLRVLNRVPDECLDLWKMMVAGFTYRDISMKIGISEGTLKIRVLRCREKAIAARKELLGSKDTGTRRQKKI